MELIIFDFDGVVADSEAMAIRLFAKGLSEIGLATTTDEALRYYMGRRWGDCVPDIEQRHGRTLPPDFITQQIASIHPHLIENVQPVDGVLAFLESHKDIARCIASSSSVTYQRSCLEQMGLTHWFEHLFSGQDVERGKPYPDLFLKAAAELKARPEACVVVEDSPIGVTAGKAAGMFTVGLCAGSHVLDGHAERLTDAGADVVAYSYDGLAECLRKHKANVR